jgi:carboxymethylenebutenolidase
VIGWCFGGKMFLELAMAAPDLDAAVMYYGHLVTDPNQLKSIKASLLGVFGNKDGSIPPDVREGAQEAGVKHQILRYDADHAFANPAGANY